MFRQPQIVFCHAGFSPVYILLAFLASAGGQANEYSVDYQVNGGASYNDNESLTAEDEKATSGIQIGLPISFSMRNMENCASFFSVLKSFKFDDSGFGR